MSDLRAALELLVTVAEQDLRHGLDASPGLRTAVSQGRAALAKAVTAQKGAHEEADKLVKWAADFVADVQSRGGIPPLHVSGDAMNDVCRALLSMREDAERWRALMSSQRIRVMGSAGLCRDDAGNLVVRPGGYMHIGVEFWNIHEAAHPSVEYPQERSREILTFYVEQLRAALSPSKGDAT